jgi:hypothetical protein
MPSTVIGNATWNSTGLVLSQQTAQEQVTGLVNVQVTYVAPVTKQSQVSAKFYTDAPPPIFPSVVLRSELVTNNLYLVDRTIERANGLLTIQANYVGALQRAGFKGYYLREQNEYGKLGQAYNYGRSRFGPLTAYVPGGGTREVGFNTSFVYDERLKVVEFVRIGRQQSVTLPTFYRADLVSVLTQKQSGISSYSNISGGGFSLSGGVGSWRFSSDAPQAVATADLWIASGSDAALRAGLLSFEKTTPVPSTESAEYVTPTVQIVTLTHRLSR